MKKPSGCVKVLIVLGALLLIGFAAVWFSISSLLSRMRTNDISRYEEEYNNRDIQRFNLFPESIPESATDVEFLSSHGMQSHEGGFYLEMTLPEEEFNSLIEGYELTTIENPDSYPVFVRDFAREGFEFYSDYEHGRGFVIDRSSHRILYFYDEFICGNN